MNARIVIFHNNLTSAVHGIPALVFDVADIGLLGREIALLKTCRSAGCSGTSPSRL